MSRTPAQQVVVDCLTRGCRVSQEASLNSVFIRDPVCGGIHTKQLLPQPLVCNLNSLHNIEHDSDLVLILLIQIQAFLEKFK